MDETQVNPTTPEETPVQSDEVVVAPEAIEGEVVAEATEEEAAA